MIDDEEYSFCYREKHINIVRNKLVRAIPAMSTLLVKLFFYKTTIGHSFLSPTAEQKNGHYT